MSNMARCFIQNDRARLIIDHTKILPCQATLTGRAMSNMASDAKAFFSSKVENIVVIWYLYLKGKTGKEIHGE